MYFLIKTKTWQELNDQQTPNKFPNARFPNAKTKSPRRWIKELIYPKQFHGIIRSGSLRDERTEIIITLLCQFRTKRECRTPCQKKQRKG